MYIVGTSGHIDHGKTSLIQALSGTDCDRLPEEKERAMTIDIGFASIDYPRFGTVSIIDVPGHERFIRNMVVGAWGIDLALLVVAVDDGWMPQTEDHFRVLQLLGIERLVVVLNKVDLADEEMIEFVIEEVREKLADTRFAESDIVKVSSKTGQGIEELREKIVENLRKLAKIAKSDKPYLFVDRTFASKGYGTVITGTLKNGVFRDDDTVQILPGNKTARIKRIESHFSTAHEGNPSQRTALNLAGVALDDLGRGHVVLKNNFFTTSRDIVADIRFLNRDREIKNNIGIEVLIGTSSHKGKLINFQEKEDKGDITARIKFDSKWFFYPGQLFVITNPGGYRILGGGTVLIPDYNSKTMKKKVKDKLSLVETCSREELAEFIISVSGWKKKNDFLSMFPESAKHIEKNLALLYEEGKAVERGEYILEKNFYEESIVQMKTSIETNVGLNLKEVADRANIDPEIARILVPGVLESGDVIEKEGRFFSGSSITEETLNPKKQNVLRQVRENGRDGIEMEKLKDESFKKEIKDLVKLDFLVSLDGNIIYDRGLYTELKDRVMAVFDRQEKFTVSEVKDEVGLSRKYIIPLLNRIEGDGLIKRIGDFRIKA